MPASIGLHMAVIALLIFGLPHVLQKPAGDEAVTVDLVPPPEAKPKAAPPPPAEADKPDRKEAESPPPANDALARQAAVRTVSPVVQFGDRDAGPRKALDGNSAGEAATPPAPREAPEKQTPPKRDNPPAPDKETVLSLPSPAETSASRPAEASGARNAIELNEAKKLFSTSATGDPLATTAMGNLPRGVRGGTLCVTELRAQLLNGSPPYFPDLLPSFPLKEGTVIDVPGAAFRAEGRWRELSYRCEVDADATKVTSFALRVGRLIPRNEWRQRGLPAQ